MHGLLGLHSYSPHLDDTERFPSFAALAPQAAANTMAAVEMLMVCAPSPPVPTMSSSLPVTCFGSIVGVVLGGARTSWGDGGRRCGGAGRTRTVHPVTALASPERQAMHACVYARTLTGKRCLSMARTIPAISTGVSPRCRSIASRAPTCMCTRVWRWWPFTTSRRRREGGEGKAI